MTTDGVIEQFAGFDAPRANYSKVPHALIEAFPKIETVSELKVILYVLRHTWGYQEFGQAKRITLDEFSNGRKKRDGSRMDGGTGLSPNSIKHGIRLAVKHGFLVQERDGRDRARSSHTYMLKMHADEGVSNSDTRKERKARVSEFDTQKSETDTQPSESDSQPSAADIRSGKETLERNVERETPVTSSDAAGDAISSPETGSKDSGSDSSVQRSSVSEVSKDDRDRSIRYFQDRFNLTLYASLWELLNAKLATSDGRLAVYILAEYVDRKCWAIEEESDYQKAPNRAGMFINYLKQDLSLSDIPRQELESCVFDMAKRFEWSEADFNNAMRQLLRVLEEEVP